MSCWWMEGNGTITMAPSLDNVASGIYTIRMHIIELPDPTLFEWDKGNREKIRLKHRISTEECEEVFQTDDIFIQEDELHSGSEERYILIGRIKKLRSLFIVFTIRNNCVRVISARNMHKKEILYYEKETRLAKI